MSLYQGCSSLHPICKHHLKESFPLNAFLQAGTAASSGPRSPCILPAWVSGCCAGLCDSVLHESLGVCPVSGCCFRRQGSPHCWSAGWCQGDSPKSGAPMPPPPLGTSIPTQTRYASFIMIWILPTLILKCCGHFPFADYLQIQSKAPSSFK